MDISAFIASNILPIITIIGGATAWFFDRKKRRADIERMKSENKSTEATALKTMQSVYDNFVEDVKEQIAGFKKRIEYLEAENKELKAENKELKKENEEIKAENKEIKNKIRELLAERGK